MSGTGSQIFTIVLLLAGVAVFRCIAGAIVKLIARGVLGDVVGERRRRRAIERMQGHTIICGFGRVGRRIGVGTADVLRKLEALFAPREAASVG